MPREKKKTFKPLHFTDYDIAGNAFRAWYDDAGKLVFVVDGTIDEFKPNVLLALDPHGERKWDDVLVNDYGVNLEDVRPKVDNKYQKLDVEYAGLDVYARLIDAYERGADVDVVDLLDFRDTAARRAAMARLVAANDIIAAGQKTIARAERSLDGLRARMEDLRARLAEQKKYVGREPPKQSASRILKFESQIDSVKEQIARTEKRIANARRRISIATEDADAARDLLARRRNLQFSDDNVDVAPEKTTMPAKRKTPSLKIKAPEPEAVQGDKESENIHLPVPEYEYQLQPRDEKMSDSEEVKPLLDQDPEILDEEIAFKPVAFDDIKSGGEENAPKKEENKPEEKEYAEPETTNSYGEKSETVARPLAFSNTDDAADEHDDVYEEDIVVKEETPVIETIKTVEEPKVSDIDTTGQVSSNQYDNNEPVRPAAPVARPAPVNDTYSRPISPITGNNVPVRPVGAEHNRSSFAYYILLILLIALSVFTLWLYQKKNGGSVPFLNATTGGMTESAEPVSENAMIGFEDSEPIVKPVDSAARAPEPEPAPIVVPIPEPVSVPEEPINIKYFI